MAGEAGKSKCLLSGQCRKSFNINPRPRCASGWVLLQEDPTDTRKHSDQNRYQLHIRKFRVSFSYSPESMSICKMQLDPAVAVNPRIPESNMKPRQARVAPALHGPRKTRPETLKNSLFLGDPWVFPRAGAHLVSERRRVGRPNETGGAGAARSGPLFAHSLSASLEMRDAYRSFQPEPFVSS